MSIRTFGYLQKLQKRAYSGVTYESNKENERFSKLDKTKFQNCEKISKIQQNIEKRPALHLEHPTISPTLIQLPPEKVEEGRIPELIKAGLSKKGKDNSQVAILTRAVMREPSPESRALLHQLHREMQKHFSTMSDEALQWLLGGSSCYAHGGFKNAEALREFLTLDPNKIKTSRLVNGLETILTAMGYRSIGASWAEPPCKAETEEQKKMAALLKKITSKYTSPPISSSYERRTEERVSTFKPGEKPDFTNLLHSYGLPEEELSEGSEDDESELTYPPEKQANRLVGCNFALKSSWTQGLHELGIESRAHTSGTAPLLLTAALGLLKPDLNNAEEVKNIVNTLSGSLIIPTFDRGDYHSIAETYAGIHFYVECINNKIRSRKDGRLSTFCLEPLEAVKLGLQAVIQSLPEKHRDAAKFIAAEYLRNLDAGKLDSFRSMATVPSFRRAMRECIAVQSKHFHAHRSKVLEAEVLCKEPKFDALQSANRISRCHLNHQ